MELRYTKPTDIKTDKIITRNPQTGEILDDNDPKGIKYRRFWLHPSTENVDFYDTIVERDAVINAFPAYIESGGNVRYMHSMEPVGKVFPMDWKQDDIGVYCGISIPLTEEKT